MRQLPSWTMVSAAGAPIFLIGGWTVAAARQTGGFDSVRDTISALAAHGATDRWLMTSALAGLGICHTVTALGFRPVAAAGRLVHGVGGVATFLVAVFPQPADGSSPAHVRAAAVGFVALGAWPALSGLGRRGVFASAALLGAVGWFAYELGRDGPLIGLSERVAAGAQALFPLALVVAWQMQARRTAGAARKALDSQSG
jgi:hypothetical membrane protein